MTELPPASSDVERLRLADRIALRELVEDYARAVDRLELAAVAALFTPDGVLEITHRDGAAPTVVRHGRDQIEAAMEGLRRYGVTAHHLAQQRLWFADDPTRASGETYCTAHHVRVVDGTAVDRVMCIRYLDDFVREDRWLIEHRRLVVDLVDERALG